MKPLLIVILLLFPLTQAQQPPATEEAAPLLVLNSKWMRDRQPVENAAAAIVGPQPAMNRESKNFERQRRINSPAGERDPRADMVDTRAGELERINQEARAGENKPTIPGFAYLVKVQNGGAKVAQSVFWEYQFRETTNPSNVARRQFVCSVKIKPEQEKTLQAFSKSGPSDVVHVKTLGKKSGGEFEGTALINRVEFSDGTFWQRKDWEVNPSLLNASAAAEKRHLPMCRGF
jgi:hypothetical protein